MKSFSHWLKLPAKSFSHWLKLPAKSFSHWLILPAKSFSHWLKLPAKSFSHWVKLPAKYFSHWLKLPAKPFSHWLKLPATVLYKKVHAWSFLLNLALRYVKNLVSGIQKLPGCPDNNHVYLTTTIFRSDVRNPKAYFSCEEALMKVTSTCP